MERRSDLHHRPQHLKASRNNTERALGKEEVTIAFRKEMSIYGLRRAFDEEGSLAPRQAILVEEPGTDKDGPDCQSVIT